MQDLKNYKKINKEKVQTLENEIRVTSKGQIKKYLGYALRILTKTDMRELLIKATGNAIVKALILIEIVKRKVGDLHQINEIKSMEITDCYEPVDADGELENFEQKHRVTCLDCKLSKDELDVDHIGYQPPTPKEAGFIHSGEGNERPHRGGARRNFNDDERPTRGAPRGGRGRGGDRPSRFNDEERDAPRERVERGGRGRREFNSPEGGRPPRGEYNGRGRGEGGFRGYRGGEDRPRYGGEGG